MHGKQTPLRPRSQETEESKMLLLVTASPRSHGMLCHPGDEREIPGWISHPWSLAGSKWSWNSNTMFICLHGGRPYLHLKMLWVWFLEASWSDSVFFFPCFPGMEIWGDRLALKSETCGTTLVSSLNFILNPCWSWQGLCCLQENRKKSSC
jgi:hypothetical protein